MFDPEYSIYLLLILARVQHLAYERGAKFKTFLFHRQPWTTVGKIAFIVVLTFSNNEQNGFGLNFRQIQSVEPEKCYKSPRGCKLGVKSGGPREKYYHLDE